MANFANALAQIGEFGLIRALAEHLPPCGDDVVLGIGDDAAAVDIGNDRYLLATCDIQIENIHFTIQGFTPEQIGWKAAAVNLSDIAAMGGTPRYALISIASPQEMKADFLVQVYRGLGECLSQWGVCVIGGNTARANEGLLLDVTLLGEVEKTRMLTRRGAKPGEVVCVTGDLGGSRAGLKMLSDSELSVSDSARQEAFSRHRLPMPRLKEAQLLSAAGVTACMDISDGLVGDAQRLAEASGVKIVVDINRLPIAACVREVAAATGADPRHFALQGGEDFELLFSVPRERFDALKGEMVEKTGTPVTVVGDISTGKGISIIQSDGKEVVFENGFDHFR